LELAIVARQTNLILRQGNLKSQELRRSCE
jgi:hypothetical protein